MKKTIRIPANFVGLVFRNNELVDVLMKGVHWVYWYSKIELYDENSPFNPVTADLQVLLKSELLKSKLTIIEVSENEVALQFINKRLLNVLTKGIYAFWRSGLEREFEILNMDNIELPETLNMNLANLHLSNYIRKYEVPAAHKALLYVNNQFVKVLDSGVYAWWKNATALNVITYDERVQNLEISGQELLTKDKANLRINFVLKYRIADAIMAITKRKEYEKLLYTSVQLTLRETIGTLTLDELLAKKHEISTEILAVLIEKANQIGLEISEAGIKDIILPGEMKEIMNQVLIAEKKAQANIIARREETAATRSLLNTAKLLEENAMLLKLKEMEYIERIAEKVGSISLGDKENVLNQLKSVFSK